ncbi:MAG: recombinase family protein, partial [Chloroflexi bacterium]|nr:recombinase family protein [Chloroflexota bacterium]
MSKRAGIYTRVSTEKQGEEGYSLDTQLEACRRYVAEQEWAPALDLDGKPIEISDQASGANLDRPGLERLRDLVTDGLLDVVVIYDLDRLAREAGLLYLLEKEFQKAGVEIHYVLTQFDNTPSGKLLKQMKASIAEFEKAMIVERLRRGKRGKARRGQVVGSACPPYGYCFAQDGEGRTVNLQIVEEEAATVRMIFEWYVYGDDSEDPLSLYAIARRLSKLRIPTWTDLRATGHVKKKERGIWDSSAVRNLLKRETYAGTWYYNRREMTGKNTRQRRSKEEWIPVEVPAIVSRELWEAAQEQLARNRNMTQPHPRYKYLLQSRLRCGQCGCALTSKTYRNNGRLYKYYTCRGNALDRGSDFAHRRCEMPSIRAEAADGLVWDHVSALLLNPRCLLEGLRARAEEAEEAVKPLKRELVGVEEAIQDQDRKLKKLLDDYLEDKLPKELLVEKRHDLERQKASLQRRQSDLQTRLNAAVITEETIVSLEDFCQQISVGLELVTFEDKRRILELLSVEGIVEWKDGDHTIKISGYFPEDVLTVGDNVFKGCKSQIVSLCRQREREISLGSADNDCLL